MRFTPAVATAILLFCQGAVSAPLPQLAGEGAAANSILSSTDNGVGYGVENAEDNTAKLISSVTGQGTKVRRQLAGEGAAADSILTDTDNGVGYGVENAEDNTANLVSSVTGKGSGSGSTGGSNPPPPPSPGPKVRRQLDKIANGAKAIGDAAGTSAVTTLVGDAGDTVDGELTSGAADAGAQIGSTEESTLEGAGSAVPKARRQLDKIANGLKAVGDAAGGSAVTTPVGDAGDSVDGELTSGAANAGAQIGSTEESTLENAGSATPKF